MNQTTEKNTDPSADPSTDQSNEAKLLLNSIMSGETINDKVNRITDNVINKIYARDYSKMFTVETIYVDNKPTYMITALAHYDDVFYGTILSDLTECQSPEKIFTESECISYIKENIHNTDVIMWDTREEYFLGTGFTAKYLDVSMTIPGKHTKISFTLSNQFRVDEFFHRRIAKLEKLVEDMFKVICQLQMEAKANQGK